MGRSKSFTFISVQKAQVFFVCVQSGWKVEDNKTREKLEKI